MGFYRTGRTGRAAPGHSAAERTIAMQCLVLSDTFPNAVRPWRGPYNRYQVDGLAELCEVSVINPIPWTEVLKHPAYARLLRGRDDVLNNAPVYHPLLLHLPLVDRAANWKAVRRAADRCLAEGTAREVDVILATFAYPHGLAAKTLAQELEVPYVIKARGSDLHSLPKKGGRRRVTREALADAAAVVTVSDSLAELAQELGCDPSRVTVLRNGVDAEMFRPVARRGARRALGLNRDAEVCLFVGNLLPVKGVDVLVDAARRLDNNAVSVAAAGTGSLSGWLHARAADPRMDVRLRPLGHLARGEVRLWMNAADVVVLPSRDEGCPNVVLEALACGTPVVASRVGEVPNILDKECGIQVEPEDAEGLADALETALQRDWDRRVIRGKVADMTWEDNARRLHRILRGVVRKQA